jgi:hypothetical protein
MLVRDPKRRATATEILKHEWMRENGVASDNALEVEVLSRIRKFSGMNKLKKEALKVGSWGEQTITSGFPYTHAGTSARSSDPQTGSILRDSAQHEKQQAEH